MTEENDMGKIQGGGRKKGRKGREVRREINRKRTTQGKGRKEVRENKNLA